MHHFGIQTRRLNREFVKSSIDNNEYLTEVQEIDGLTAELIEKINDRGFYLVRIPQKQPFIGLNDRRRVKILFASANPIDLSPLRLDKELREIEYELLKSRLRDNF